MENVILIIHLILALAIIGLVLIQRSEGGGLGIGGGGGGLGGFASAGGTASALTKMTAFFAACFFCTSLTLAILAGAHHNEQGILETFSAEEAGITAPAVPVGQEAIVSEEAAPVSEESAPEVDATEENSEPVIEKPSVPIGE